MTGSGRDHPLCSITLMMETASTSEMSVNFYQTARHNNLEDSHLRAPGLAFMSLTKQIFN
jgi:hypothetical protein